MSEELIHRFNQVLEVVYDGNLQRMATALGMDRSTCSRHKTGKVVPTRRTLLALSREAGVDLEWLLKGGDEEIRFLRPSQREAGLLPVLEEPVEDDPPESYPRWRGVKMETVGYYVKPDHYWIDVQVQVEGTRLRRRDYVLVRQVKEPFAPSHCNVGTIYAVKNGDRRFLHIIGKSDVKPNSGMLVIGEVLLFQGRDPVAESSQANT